MRSRDAAERPGDDDEGQALVEPMATTDRPRIEIGDALRNGWVEVWYQPKIDLKRKCLSGAEASARICHPQLGVTLPASFLPAASDDSVAALAEHMLVTALRSWSLFEAAGFHLQLAINVPVGVLFGLPIAELVEAHRPKSERWPGVILEVIEDQIVRNIARANDVADRLRASGVKISIDDFGAGYSSLSSLRELPFVEIKLDESFVRNCATDPANAAICQTAIDLAHRFGSAAVAEGIETQVDLQALIVMGCDFGQGNLIAPSMPQARFLELLSQRLGGPRMPGYAAPSADDAVGRVA